MEKTLKVFKMIIKKTYLSALSKAVFTLLLNFLKKDLKGKRVIKIQGRTLKGKE